MSFEYLEDRDTGRFFRVTRSASGGLEKIETWDKTSKSWVVKPVTLGTIKDCISIDEKTILSLI